MSSVVSLVLFVTFAIGMWVYVSRRIADGGWNDLAVKFRALRAPHGKKIGAVSGWFPRSRYSNSLTFWATEEGFFLRSVFFFRDRHPALFIPWTGVVAMSEEKEFLSLWTIIECDVDGLAFLLKIPGSHQPELARHVSRQPNQAAQTTPGLRPSVSDL